jgi:hypothetical protein
MMKDCLKMQIEKSLRENVYANNLHDVKVAEENDRIILYGKVKTYFMKQMAQVVAMRLVDGIRLRNQISVESASTLEKSNR